MRAPIRTRYFIWLSFVLLLFMIVQTVAWFAYEFSEWWTGEAESLAEEMGEVLVVVGIHVATIPFMLVFLWILSKHLLRPLHEIATTAQRIEAGDLDTRIEVETTGDDLGILAHTINKAFDQYQDAVSRLQRFSADASHQLRTPLTAIRSTGEVCLQKERQPQEYVEAMDSMLEDARRLSHTVDQLLLLARLDASDEQTGFAVTDVNALVAGSAERYQDLAEIKRITLSVSLGESVRTWANPLLLEQVVANLLDNALKYTPEGGVIEVSTSPRDEQFIRIAVRNTGPGIPQAYLARIFDRFSTVPGTAESGSGLGLAIVADIARLHGGTVEALSEPEQGAELRVDLPRQEGPEGSPCRNA